MFKMTSFKNYCLLLALLFTTKHLQAQITAVIDPFPVNSVVEETPIPEDVVGHSTLTITGGDATIYWEISVVCAPPEWEFAVCDINACWSTTIHARSEDLIDGEPSRMDVHLYPNSVAGYGEAIVNISLLSAPLDILYTGKYTFQVNTPQDSCSAVTGLDELVLNAINIYPNPVQDHFQITANDLTDQVLIYNATGTLVKTFKYQENQTYTVADLPSGIYMVALLNAQQGLVKTERLAH